MPGTQSAQAVLDREFLEMRAKLLELAASLDRLDRADGDVGQDDRMMKIGKALTVLASKETNRAEQFQLIFSLPYDSQWRERMAVPGS